jgi:hypothetical protein
LQLFQGPGSSWPEDPVDPTAVEAEAGETRLKFGDVVTAEVRGSQEQQPVAELPARLDQRRPGLFVATTVGTQTTAALKGANRFFSRTTIDRALGTCGGWKSGGTEAALQISNGLAALTGCQREVGRNSLSS